MVRLSRRDRPYRRGSDWKYLRNHPGLVLARDWIINHYSNDDKRYWDAGYEKYSGRVSAAEGVALVTGVAYFGFVIGPPLMGFVADLITLRWAMLIPALLAIIFGLSAKKVLS